MTGEKTVLITGTSSGIGLAAAVAAAQAGWHVVATMRDLSRGGALREAATTAGVDGQVEVRRLDVTDAASVTACIEGVVADHGHLDALVNNAGAGHLGTIERDSVEDVRAVMEVNFFGVVQTTRAALVHLRAAGGRLVTVGSVGGVIGQPFNEAYCAAKFAVEGFMEALAPVVAPLGVRVTVVEPGPVSSEFVNNIGLDVERLAEAAGPYRPALASYLARLEDIFATAQTPAEAATTVVQALTAAEPPLRMQTSSWARDFASGKLADVDGSRVLAMTGEWVTTEG
ncbi:SDR family oxidoreductase [Streptomyces sp. NPDC049585]|uniref:SDR family oxidoreductase n=1 Tax=Streptomyces sp. NPDC049585 TaxID=3155154 RepID=UPI00344792A3